MTVSRAADHTAGDRQGANAWALKMIDTLCSGSFSERVNLYAAASLMAAGVHPSEFGDPELVQALTGTESRPLTIDQLQAIADRLGATPEGLLAAVSR